MDKFYLIKKEKGVTSYDVVRELKKKLNTSKIGHSGTLDPLATGLLIIATGSYTKILNRILSSKKVYEGKMEFGFETDTLDITGLKTITNNKNIEFKNIKESIEKNFLGKIMQVPPQFSAIKINGQKSYNLARKGEFVSHNPVEREIYKFKIKKISNKIFYFKVEVSSGTYIRSLVQDIGRSLNNNACLIELKRISIGKYNLKKSLNLNSKKIKGYDAKNFLNLPFKEISENSIKDALDGKIISIFSNSKECFVTFQEKMILMKKVGNNKYKIKKSIK